MKSNNGFTSANPITEGFTESLIRDDLEEFLWEILPLWDRTHNAAVLASVYSLSTKGLQLFDLYRLAIEADQVVLYQKAGLASEITCLQQLYGDRWMQMPTKLQKSITKDFRRNLQAGNILMALVARFGTGILLMCPPKVHQM